MTDHAVLIPTSEGAVGGIVSEPDGERRAALVLLGGYGRPARSGINSFWTRTARALAELGVVVLRIDYSCEGETIPIGEGGGGRAWKRDLDLLLLRQVTPWFCERAGDLPLLLAGSCSGARLAIELAGCDPEVVAGTFLIVPYLLVPVDPGDKVAFELNASVTVDPLVVSCLRAVLNRASSWVLVGEHDTPDIPLLEQLLGPTAHDLEVEVVPDTVLHLLDQPQLQDEVAPRLIARVSQALGSRSD